MTPRELICELSDIIQATPKAARAAIRVANSDGNIRPANLVTYDESTNEITIDSVKAKGTQ